MESTDAVLIEDIQAGDREALVSLMQKYRHLVYRVAYRITRNHEDASDIFQETFLKVAQSIQRFRADSSFETWLYRIAVNLSLNAIKKAERRSKTHQAAFDLMPLRHVADPAKQVVNQEIREQVHQAIAKLSPAHRTAVILHDLEGLTHTEIASILSCSVGTVRSRLHYARRQLRTILSPYVG